MSASRFSRNAVLVVLIAGIVLCSRITQPAPGKAHAAPMFASFTVNSLLDSADINPGDGVCDSDAGAPVVCTLRAAIQEANALAGADSISFSVTGTITLATVLPAITQQVTITGTTTGVLLQPQVAINANSLEGLWFSSTATSTSSNSSVSGLAIRNTVNPGIALRIEPGAGGLAVSNVSVSGCWFGMNDAGTTANNNHVGIGINNSTSNRIGGTTASERNVICGSTQTGVRLTDNANSNIVEGNLIGLRPDGTAQLNNFIGVQIIGSTNNVIGGTGAPNRNIISGNGTGVVLTDVAAPGGNQIANNYIGLDETGLIDAGNGGHGISVSSAFGTIIRQNVISGNNDLGISLTTLTTFTSIVGNTIGLNAPGTNSINNTNGGIQISEASINNTIGGTTDADRNVISGHANGNIAIEILFASNGNQVLGNYIGTNAAGTAAIPNAFGIVINNATGNIIGAVGSGRNIISGNNQDGISITDVGTPGNNQVVGNYIGLLPDGTTPLGNGQDGIFIGDPGAVQNIIGPGNVISANQNGIQLDVGANINQIIGNIIGLDAGGTIDLGNNQSGIQVGAATGMPSTSGNTIGGTTAADRNVISGNGTNGIQIQQGAANNQILGNYIGTNAAGDAAIPNMPNGILFAGDAGMGNNIGSSTAGSGNLISGNQQDGIQFSGANDVGTSVKRNLIGLAAGGTTASTSGVPNGQWGIQVVGATTNLTIGRSEGGASPSGEGNLIAFNGISGIAITATGPARVLISENSIFSNGQLGIDLAPLGVTANDTDTAALSGPNGNQNFPVITAVGAGSVTITGTLDSVASTSFTLEFFSSASCETTGFGEGRTFLGSTTVTTNSSGNAAFNVTFAVTPSLGEVVTATATRSVAGVVDVTSEFSQCRIVLQSTAVEFAGFAARSYERGVELEWSTGFETSNLGFNLYRDRRGERERLNSSLIAGSALMIGAEARLLSGNSYRWWDARPHAAASTYWVEAIDLNGTSQWHGPYAVLPGDGREPRSRPQTHTVMLSEVNRLIADGHGSHSVEPHAELPDLDSPMRATQQQIAALPAVKIGVERAGWYRLTQPQLVSAGLSPAINPRMLQLFVDGEQVPISVTGELDGKFDPGDTVEFYGLGLDLPSTAERTYWLLEGGEPGRRVPQASLDGGATAPSSFAHTVERDEREVYFSNLLNGETENFFGAVVRNSPTEQLLMLTHVDAAAGGQAEFEIALQGVTVQPHRVRVSLNGTAITTLDFFGKALGSAKVEVAQTLLREGPNAVMLEAELGTSDLSLVDYVRVTYSRKYLADSNRVFVTVPGGTKVSIGGFTASDVRVFEVGDPKAVVELAGTVSGGNGEFGIEVTTDGGGTKKLFAVSNSNVENGVKLKANAVSRLARFAGRGDLFVLTHATLTEALRPLIDQRRRDGWRVVVADVEDVYDEYSFGHKTPKAVREWLRAMEKRNRTFSYLLLAGDGSFDPRNYLGVGDTDLVPAKSIDTSIAETASDDWFADFNGDGVSEMPVGRLPARTAAEAAAMVTKILAYERGSSGQGATLISDVNDTFNFLGTSNRVKGFLPPSTAVEMIISGQTPDVRARLLESLGKGPKLVNYAGHGSVDLWRGNVFTSADALSLGSSGKVSVYLLMTCLNGYYHAPNLDSLAESLLKAPGGAAAVWASSGFTVPTDQEELNVVMVRTLYERSGMTLGRAIQIAKTAIGDPDVRRTWILLGDPTMVYN